MLDGHKAELAAQPTHSTNILLDSKTFLAHLSGRNFQVFPSELQTILKSKLSAWTGLQKSEDGDGNQYLNKLLATATMKVSQADQDDLFENNGFEVARFRHILGKNAPISFPIESEYTPEELDSKFPQASEIRAIIGTDARIRLHLHITGEFYISEGQQGRKTIRIINSSRSPVAIQQDLENLPPVFPTTIAHQLNDGSYAIVTDWVEGHYPKTEEEITLCEKAITLWQQEHPQTPFDTNRSNFLIAPTEGTQGPKVYYVDKDIVDEVVEHGLGEIRTQETEELS